jgi:acyl carrier protein phosphodiesterase
LLKSIGVLPPQVQGFLPIMIAKNRLYSYSKIEGLRDALERMAQYTSLPEASDFCNSYAKKITTSIFNQQFSYIL